MDTLAYLKAALSSYFSHFSVIGIFYSKVISGVSFGYLRSGTTVRSLEDMYGIPTIEVTRPTLPTWLEM
jgi:hypothetical protein